MSINDDRPGDKIDNQTVVLITATALVVSGIMFDWHCYGLAIGLGLVAFFGIILMFVRYDDGRFR